MVWWCGTTHVTFIFLVLCASVILYSQAGGEYRNGLVSQTWSVPSFLLHRIFISKVYDRVLLVLPTLRIGVRNLHDCFGALTLHHRSIIWQINFFGHFALLSIITYNQLVSVGCWYHRSSCILIRSYENRSRTAVPHWVQRHYLSSSGVGYKVRVHGVVIGNEHKS